MDSKYFLLLIGLPHNSHSDGVSGNFSFSIVVRGSQNGTNSNIEKNNSGAIFATAVPVKPPAEPPKKHIPLL